LRASSRFEGALTGKASIGEEIGETHGCGCEVLSGNKEKKGTKKGGLLWFEVGESSLGINEEAQEKKKEPAEMRSIDATPLREP
jgi:hypothetical protein